jgi:magnesium transporter
MSDGGGGGGDEETLGAALSRPLAPRLRLIYREGGGTVHLDWPLARLRESLADAAGLVWMDVDDRYADLVEVEALFRDVFGFHPLAIDDALRESNVAKLDDWGDYLYGVFQCVGFDGESLEITLDELDFFLGPNFLVTYHSVGMKLLDDLRDRIGRDGGQRLRHGADHLLYHLLDLGVAGYMPAYEALDEAIDRVQDEILDGPHGGNLQRIIRIKHASMRLHRAILPQREVLNRLARDEHAVIDRKDRVYFRDVYDHLVRLHDISETLRDLIAGALDIYLTAVSNRTNEVMKTFTLVTVLFLPLNFVVGFFGMNFFGDNIALRDLGLSHGLLFAAICGSLVAAPWGLWIWSRWRGWF